MPRIEDVLEREGRTVDLEPGDFERLLGRRDRRQRNRRIRAGALGVVVALAMGIFFVKSLTSDEVPANPPVEPAPLSGPLAYDTADEGQIHVAGLDGSNPVAVADIGTIDDDCPHRVRTFMPSWSPDGRYLAFSRLTACGDPTSAPGSTTTRWRNHDVVIADLQGNVVDSFRVSVEFPTVLAWSPDSTRVAVWDEFGWDARGVGTFTMGVYGIDGTSETFPMPDGWEHPTFKDPIWTPDGASLIVGELEIPLDGGAPREIPFHGTFQDPSGGVWTGALVYSPDGSQMAYGTPRGLMVARADGSDPRVVTDDGAHTAAWSPNGELIAVASATPGTDQFTRVPRHGAHDQAPDRLRIVDVATGSVTVLSEGEGTFFHVIGFSPGGDRVLFGEHRPVVGQPEGTYLDSIWSVRIDGSDARQIAVGTYTGDVRPT